MRFNLKSMGDAENTTILAELHYADPEAALNWLSQAFGFEPDLIVKGPDGEIAFARASFDSVQVAILPEQPPRRRSPLASGGIVTQSVQVRNDAMSTPIVRVLVPPERSSSANPKISSSETAPTRSLTSRATSGISASEDQKLSHRRRLGGAYI